MGNVIKMAERFAFSSVTATADADASTFFTASTITDFVQQIAINQLIVDFKLFGLWSKCIAIYPFVGGTASTHKWNLKDPRDLDAAFRLVFSGGWTHSATGALPNGTTGYADTFLIPSTGLSLNNAHVSYYSGTIGGAVNRCEIGTGNNAADFVFLAYYYTGSIYNFAINQTAGSTLANTLGTTYGFLCANRTASNVIKGSRNDSVLVNAATVSTALSVNSITLGAWNNNGTKTAFSTKECRFATIGSGLTDADTLNLYTCIQKYQGTLNRAVYG